MYLKVQKRRFQTICCESTVGIILATQPVVTMAEMLMLDWLHQQQQIASRRCVVREQSRPQRRPRQLQPLFRAEQVQRAIRAVRTVSFNQVTDCDSSCAYT